MFRAVPPGGVGGGGVGGCNTPKKRKKGEPNLRGRGPDMLELQIFFKLKDLFAENFWENVVCERFWELLFFKKHCRPLPPPRRQHFPEKFLLCGKFFLGGPRLEGDPNFGIHPPTRNRLARP